MATTKNKTTTELAVIANDISYIKLDVADIKLTLTQNYVTSDKHAILIDRVDRLEKIVYFTVAIFGATLLTAIANFFIHGAK